MSSENCEYFKTLFVFIKQAICAVLCTKLFYCEREIFSIMNVVKKLHTNLFYYRFWPLARQIVNQKCIPMHIDGFDELKSQQIVENFNRTYKQKDNLTKSLVSVFWKRFIVTIVFRLLLTGLYYAYPVYFYPYFLNFAHNDATTYVEGLLMVLQLTVASLGITYCINKNFEIQNIISMEIKTIIMHLVNSKILRDICDRENRVKFNTSLITTDLQAITSFLTDLNYIWVFALMLTITLSYLYYINESFAIIALISLISVLCTLEYLISKLVGQYDKKHKAIRSKRLSMLKEVIYGIKVIKLYGLNKEDKLKNLRSKEVRELKRLQLVETLLYIIQTVAPLILYPLFMLISFIISSQPLTIEKIFVTLGYLEVMNYPTKMCSKLWICRTKLKNSWDRINKFLNDPDKEYIAPEEYVSESNVAIKFDNVAFNCAPHEYSNINFDVPKGSMNVIIGNIGAGKTSFLSAILKLVNSTGTINLNGTVSYVPAEPFLFQDTLEENIVFGSKNAKLYEEILEKLCLKQDLSELPNHDKTEINERGVNLSGGQKQRICLARSVYQDAGIYLLDDPLTSVDIKVTRKILYNILNRNDGLLKDKTVLYVANNFSIFNNFHIDNVIIVAQNSINITPFEAFQKTNLYSDLTRPITTNSRQINNEAKQTQNKKSNKSTSETRIVCETDELLSKDLSKPEDKQFFQIVILYESFAKQFGKFWILVVILLSIFGLMCSIESYQTLSALGTSPDKYETLLKYGLLKLTEISIMIINWMIIFYCCLNLSNRLFTKGLGSLFKLPIQYFHKMSSGGVSYLFSSDFAATDTTLPKAFRDLVQIMFTMLSSIASMWYLSKWNYWTGIGIGASFVLIALYIALIRFNMQISFILKSTERDRSLMISKYFADAEAGAVIIKTNGMVDNFKERLYKKLDAYLKQALMSQFGHRWFTCHLEFLGIAIVFITLSALVMLNSSSAAFGIALICTGKIIYNLNQLNLSITNVNNRMVSFDKIDEFVNLSHEQDDGTQTIAEEEPITITFDNVNSSYDGRPVLNGISFELESSDRLGIIGRTGSGKSTLISALLRLIEIDSGEIQICGKNIKHVKLECLRNLITLIPQECDIFNGSLVQNLDPSNLYKSDDIDKMLNQVNLKDKITTLQDQLNTKLSYDSKDVSDGEKQLFCLVRGLLRNTKIMIFDETCSKVNLKTERLIQDLLNSEQYCNSIMMVVAHRLQSLDICNKILVLDNGHIIEYGLKEDLMQNTSSEFHKYIKAFTSAKPTEI